jgi:phosphate uptake regulator
LIDIGSRSISVSSGWRPQAINKIITGAAKNSHHMTGKAIDLVDSREQELARKIESRPDLLDKHQLWMEDRYATPGWVHLDIGSRSPRKVRIFKP